jgi:hypothetical protein
MEASHSLSILHNKRRKPSLRDPFSNNPTQHVTTEALFEDAVQEQQDFWTNSALFAIDVAPLPASVVEQYPIPTNPRKRSRF